jgi:hypothetical protein
MHRTTQITTEQHKYREKRGGGEKGGGGEEDISSYWMTLRKR